MITKTRLLQILVVSFLLLYASATIAEEITITAKTGEAGNIAGNIGVGGEYRGRVYIFHGEYRGRVYIFHFLGE